MDEFKEAKEKLENQEQDKELEVDVKDWVDDSKDSDEEKAETNGKLNNVSFGLSAAQCAKLDTGTQNYCYFAGSGRFR